MRKRDFAIRGAALTLAAALGMGAIPVSGTGTAKTVYAAEETGMVLAGFDFASGIAGWSYGAGWEYDYSGAAASSVEAEDGMLKMNVDFSADAEKSWSQATAVWDAQDGGLNLTGASLAEVDVLYDEANRKTGSFTVKLYSGVGIDAYSALDLSAAETVSGSIKKVHAQISFEALGAAAADTKQIGLQLVGNETDYKGAVWFDNLELKGAAEEDVNVDSTIAVKAGNTSVSVSGGQLVTQKKDGSAQKTALAKSVTLVDKKATAQAKKIYAYLKAVGTSDSVIYGHQDDTFQKAGSSALTNSDTKDVTGSIAGIFGIDTLALTGNEYSAKRYNETHDTSLAATPENNVKAAALMTNEAVEEGAIVTLSAHMPNFANVKTNKNYKASEPAYAKYEFGGYTVNNTTNDPMNQILPGGKYNKVYNAYLDMIADYAKQVDSAILFRPFHENTGSWFWWGAAFCDAETYKNVFRYTVEYLRDTKGVHNMLYEYGPSNTGTGSVADYGLRYPGDEYVDIVGFDMYDSKPQDDGVWMAQFKKQLKTVSAFAKKHGKLTAVSETGAANDAAAGENQTALLKSGNGNKNWYRQVLNIVSASDASYFLLWANFGKKDGYYTPYVDSVNADGSLNGHEMLDGFISFYNDARTVFAADQKKALSGSFGKITVKAAASGTTGYLTQPIAGQRLLKVTTVRAKVTDATSKTKVKFVLKAGKKSVTLNAKSDKKGYYTAKLSTKKLQSLGKKVGTLALYINGKKVQSISETYNIKAPKDDPYLIDSFENYYGVDEQLGKAWTTNADTDCRVTLSLTKKYKSQGDYGLKFTYDETATGWGGATISREVDWSKCNALQFYMVPDGKNQKTVIQITANGVVYEAYLNTYDAFVKNGKKPMKITIPFSEFCQRDTEGNPKGGLAADSKNIQSFGLWINAISGSGVKGTIYYDNITAVKSSAKKPAFTVVK